MKMMPLDTIAEIDDRIRKADAGYGNFASVHEALGVCAEEWDELRAAIHANTLDQVRHEALDLAAALIRLANQIGVDQKLRARSVPSQAV